MADMSGIDELLTADEVAELLHIPRSTVSEYARRGVLPSIKLGRHRRFVRSDVAEAIELCERMHSGRDGAIEPASGASTAAKTTVAETADQPCGWLDQGDGAVAGTRRRRRS